MLNSVSTTLPPFALWQLFRRILVSVDFDYLNGYFDNDNGQTLFLDGIVMDIMVENGEI